MMKLRSFFSISILHVALHLAMVHAQDDQSGFISIDCGIPEGSTYTDKTTGINYVSDAGFIEVGENREISSTYNLDTLELDLTTLRSFPQSIRNCYTLRPKQGKNNKYLIRLRYMHGNYDPIGLPIQFHLYLGADLWYNHRLSDPSSWYFDEIIHVAKSDFINICLVNTGQGVPFVSVIELRLLDNTMYEFQSKSLNLFFRYSFGSTELVRYEDDIYDRIWSTFTEPGYRAIENSVTYSSDYLKLPSKVLSTAIKPTNSTNSISFTWDADDITDKYIMYLHFTEVETLKINQTREFSIYVNDYYWYGPLSPSSTITTIESTSPSYGFSSYTLKINRTLKSTLPPTINALEIYKLRQFQQQKTEDQDTAAIWSIKSTYSIKRNWQGDPCVPQEYMWDGLNCSYRDMSAVRIISMNLSSSGLSGEIATALANLTMIESLDLSYNKLTGNVPEFLGRQNNLKILNLTGNNFIRPIPEELLQKAEKGSLTLSIEPEASSDQHKSACPKGSCINNKHKTVIIAAIVIPVVVLLIMAVAMIIWMIKRRERKDVIPNPKDDVPNIKANTRGLISKCSNRR